MIIDKPDSNNISPEIVATSKKIAETIITKINDIVKYIKSNLSKEQVFKILTIFRNVPEQEKNSYYWIILALYIHAFQTYDDKNNEFDSEKIEKNEDLYR